MEIGKSTVGIDKSTVGIDRSTVGIDKSTVGIDRSTVGIDKSTVGIDKSTVGIDKSWIKPLICDYSMVIWARLLGTPVVPVVGAVVVVAPVRVNPGGTLPVANPT